MLTPGGNSTSNPGSSTPTTSSRRGAERDDRADEWRVRAETALPELVAEDRPQRWRRQAARPGPPGAPGCGAGGGGAVGVGEITTLHDPRAEQSKQIRRGIAGPDLLGLAASPLGHDDLPSGRQRRHFLEHRRLRAQIVEIGRRPGEPGHVAVPQVVPHVHEPVGLGVRQRLQQHRIDDAENGRGGADPKASVEIAVIANAGFLRNVLAA